MAAIKFEKQGHAAWITLNRPEAKNLMNAEMFILLAEAWEEVRNDPDIRVAVLTGAGDKDFCCGGDLGGVIPLWTGTKQPSNELEEKLVRNPLIVDDVMLKGKPLYKPIIGAFNGRTLGGGCEILQATDIRIAAGHAVFGLPEPKSGIVPGAGSMVRLVRQISYANAMKLLMTAEPIDAQTAKEIGLISEVVPAKELQSRAAELAEIISANAPVALSCIKKTVLETHTSDWDPAFRFEMEQAGVAMMTEDAREGPRAFREKRKPDFKGK